MIIIPIRILINLPTAIYEYQIEFIISMGNYVLVHCGKINILIPSYHSPHWQPLLKYPLSMSLCYRELYCVFVYQEQDFNRIPVLTFNISEIPKELFCTRMGIKDPPGAQ